MKNLTSLIAVAAIAVCSFTSARADDALEPHAVPVRFADLNTASAAGAAALYQRIESAAKSACRDLEPERKLSLVQPYTRCVHQALAGAVAKVDRPAVTAYAVARGILPAASIAIASTR